MRSSKYSSSGRCCWINRAALCSCCGSVRMSWRVKLHRSCRNRPRKRSERCSWGGPFNITAAVGVRDSKGTAYQFGATGVIGSGAFGDSTATTGIGAPTEQTQRSMRAGPRSRQGGPTNITFRPTRTGAPFGTPFSRPSRRRVRQWARWWPSSVHSLNTIIFNCDARIWPRLAATWQLPATLPSMFIVRDNIPMLRGPARHLQCLY